MLQKQVQETAIEEVEQQRNNETELSEDSHHNNTDNNTTETVNNDSDSNYLIIPKKELYENIQTVLVFREICSEEGEMSKRMN